MKKVFICILIIVLCSFCMVYADGLDVMYTPDEVRIENGETTLQVLRISSNDTSGLHSIILTLIGDYNPIVKDYTYTSTQGYTSHSIEIQPDWSWIMTCALFIIVVWSTFRFVGGIFTK